MRHTLSRARPRYPHRLWSCSRTLVGRSPQSTGTRGRKRYFCCCLLYHCSIIGIKKIHVNWSVWWRSFEHQRCILQFKVLVHAVLVIHTRILRGTCSIFYITLANPHPTMFVNVTAVDLDPGYFFYLKDLIFNRICVFLQIIKWNCRKSRLLYEPRRHRFFFVLIQNMLYLSRKPQKSSFSIAMPSQPYLP